MTKLCKLVHCSKPFDTIVIEGNGDSYICGLQFDYTYMGNVLSDTINTIWNNNSIRELRKKVYNNELYSKCANCLHREEKEIGPDPLDCPSEIFLRISNICNLKCEYCDLNKNNTHTSNVEELFLVVKKLLKNATFLNITGGEPLLIWKTTSDILGYMSRVNPQCAIYLRSNGTILNDCILARLREQRKLKVLVSVDAFSRDTYFVMKGRDMLKDVKVNITRLLDSGIDFELQFLVTKKNYLELIPFVNWCRLKGYSYYYRLLVSPHEYSLHDCPLKYKYMVIHTYEENGINEFGVIDSLRSGILYST